jgi:hypothetical protein
MLTQSLLLESKEACDWVCEVMSLAHEFAVYANENSYPTTITMSIVPTQLVHFDFAALESCRSGIGGFLFPLPPFFCVLSVALYFFVNLKK